MAKLWTVLSGRFLRKRPRAVIVVHWGLVVAAAVWCVLVVWLKPNTPKAPDREAQIAHLRENGAAVRRSDDPVLGPTVTLVSVYPEHFSPDGRVRPDILQLIAPLGNEILSFAHTPFADEAISDLLFVETLRGLDVSYTRITDSGLSRLTAFPHLEMLRVSGCSITDQGLRQLMPLRDRLRVLYVSWCPVTDDGVKSLIDFQRLEALKLTGTRISDASVPHLRSLPALSYLGLNETDVSDESVEVLSHLRRLRVLDLRRTAMTVWGVQVLRERLPQCSVLY